MNYEQTSTKIRHCDYGEVTVSINEGPPPDSMETFLTLDTETELIVPGQPILPVILQVFYPNLRHVDVVPYTRMFDYMEEVLEKYPECDLAYHSPVFDIRRQEFQKSKRFLKALSRGKIVGVDIRYRLWQLDSGQNLGRYSLDHMVKDLFGREIPKDEAIRLTFKRNMYMTMAHLVYAATDVIETGCCYMRFPKAYPTEFIQIMGDIGLRSASEHGLLVDMESFKEKQTGIQEKLDRNVDVLSLFGYRKGEKGNSTVAQHILENIEKRADIKFPRTEKTKMISISGEAAVQALGKVNHAFVKSLKEHTHLNGLLSKYFNEDLIGVDNRVHPRFDLIKKTGRTSCKKPNIQNVPRQWGIRGIYVAPEGYLLCGADYDQLELCALAQTCWTRYGKSVMREVINSGEDLHKWFGRIVMSQAGVTETEDTLKDFRQKAKACFTGKTELLTPTGWRRIDTLHGSDTPVVVYDPEKKTTFLDVPCDWVVKDSEEIISFESPHMHLSVTPDHRMIQRLPDGSFEEVLAENWEPSETASSIHGGMLGPVWQEYAPYTEIAMALFFGIVPGHSTQSTALCRYRSQADRDKAAELLEKNGVSVVTSSKQDLRARVGYRDFLTAGGGFKSWLSYDAATFRRELYSWIGKEEQRSKFYSSRCSDAQVVETLLALSGERTEKFTHTGRKGQAGKGVYFGGDLSTPEYTLNNMKKRRYKSKVKVYCPTVSTGWLLTRKNGKMTVAGNCNFGFPGGLGIPTFQELAKSQYKVDFTIDECKELKALWMEAFPEMEYHLQPLEDEQGTKRNIYRAARQYGLKTNPQTKAQLEAELRMKGISDKEISDVLFKLSSYMATTLTGRVRRGCTYTSACNLLFQGLAADGGKLALGNLTLSGLQLVNFIHDEFLTEIKDDEHVQENARKVSEIAIKSMQMVIPDVKIGASPYLMRRWYKNADTLYDDNGNLLVWTPELAEAMSKKKEAQEAQKATS